MNTQHFRTRLCSDCRNVMDIWVASEDFDGIRAGDGFYKCRKCNILIPLSITNRIIMSAHQYGKINQSDCGMDIRKLNNIINDQCNHCKNNEISSRPLSKNNLTFAYTCKNGHTWTRMPKEVIVSVSASKTSADVPPIALLQTVSTTSEKT